MTMAIMSIDHLESDSDLSTPAFGMEVGEALPASMIEGLRHMSCWAVKSLLACVSLMVLLVNIVTITGATDVVRLS